MPLVFFLRSHGARPNEAAALNWDDIDLRKGIAYVVASYHYREVCEPKTRAARRSIYQRWWPRDREAVRATYAMLDPAVQGPNCHRIATGGAKKPVYTAKRKWTMSPSWTR